MAEETPAQPAAPQMRTDLVRAFDPKRGEMIMVTPMQAGKLQAAGYAVGDEEARAMAHASGWAGQAMTFGAAALSGVTGGLTDAFMPRDLHEARQILATVNPDLEVAGQALGTGLGAYVTGGLSLVPRVAARATIGAVAGGTEEYLRAYEHSEPINAERIVQQAGLGALINVGAEAAGAVIGQAGKAISKTIDIGEKYYRPGAKVFDEELGKVVRKTLIEQKYMGEGSIFGKIAKAAAWNTLVPGYKSALTADAAIVAVLNNAKAANDVITKYITPAAKMLGKTVTALTEIKAQNVGPEAPENDREMYKAWRSHLEHVVANPQAIDAGVGEIVDFSNHQMLRAGVTTKATQQAMALYDALPKNPNPVMIGAEHWEPTDKQVKDFMSLAETVTNFPKAMENPTRGKIMMAQMTNPSQLGLLQDTLAGHLIANGTKGMSPQQMRNISLILGFPINHKTDPQFIAKMQVLHRTAGQPNAPAPSLRGGAKPKSTTLGATNSQKLDFGLE